MTKTRPNRKRYWTSEANYCYKRFVELRKEAATITNEDANREILDRAQTYLDDADHCVRLAEGIKKEEGKWTRP